MGRLRVGGGPSRGFLWCGKRVGVLFEICVAESYRCRTNGSEYIVASVSGGLCLYFSSISVLYQV